MVVHKHDNPNVSITQLLTAVRECKENEENNQSNRRAEYAKAYPASTSRPTYGADRAAGHHSNPVPADVQQGDYPPQYQDYDDMPEREEYEFYAKFYAATVDMANKVERRHNLLLQLQRGGTGLAKLSKTPQG